MPTNVLMPALSPTMTEGTLSRWLKNEGDAVKAGDVLAEIETDKATMEVEAVDEGTLGKILVQEGTAGVAVNAPIAILLEEGEDAGSLAAPQAKKGSFNEPAANKQDKEEAKATEQKATMHGDEGAAATTSPSPGERDVPPKPEGERTNISSGDRVFASPLARRMAEQTGVDLSSLKGSGPNGRIVKTDLAGARASPQPPSGGEGRSDGARVQANAPSSGPNAKQLADMLGMKYKEIPNSGVRKVIARRLVESKQTVPHFYLTIDCRIDELLRTRAALNKAGGDAYKLSVNDFVIKACANALKAYPAANVAWTDDAILQYEQADISVAVATPNGLITPIVKAAETKGLAQISAEVKDLAKRARDGKLKPEEFQGGTFSVSNLGMFGIQEFGAIINPPQACILAVGAGEERPCVEDGKIAIGTFMKCTLSVDHRAVDGAIGAEYLQILKRYIESPAAMLV